MASGWTGGSPRCRPGAGATGGTAGFRLAAPAEDLTGAALIGQAVLYHWPTEGWVRGTVARRVHARGALRPHFGARVGGDSLASRRGLARPGRALGAPPSCALAWPSFSRTPVMGLPARGGPGLGLSGAAQTNR